MPNDIYTVTNIGFIGTPTPTISYQWKRNGISIPNATGISYEIVDADYSTTLSVDVTINNMYGSTTKTLTAPIQQEFNYNSSVSNIQFENIEE